MIFRLTKSGGFLVSLLSVFMYLSLKCKTSAISLVETACMFLIFLITSMQISTECETKESEAKFAKYRYRVNLHLIVLNSSHRINYCDSFTESKFDIQYVNKVKSAT